MELRLFVNVLDEHNHMVEKVDFFYTAGSTCCNEKELLRGIDQTIAILKENLYITEINLEARLKEPRIAVNRLKRVIKSQATPFGNKLSKREGEVANLIVQGLTNKEISKQLFISFETVRSHRKSILKKTGLKNTAALISYFREY